MLLCNFGDASNLSALFSLAVDLDVSLLANLTVEFLPDCYRSRTVCVWKVYGAAFWPVSIHYPRYRR